MKNIVFFFFFFSSLVIFANQTYEPKLESYYIEKDQVYFKLDNGLVFIGESPNRNMFYALDRLVGMHARIQTFPESAFLDITFENPTQRGCDKISFLGWLTEETYKQLVTVTELEVDKSFFFPSARVTLSDGSHWTVKNDRLFRLFVEKWWSKDDHILVTKNYSSEKEYSLVNLDVSGYHYVDYFKERNEHWYSMRDARTVEALPRE